MKLAWPIEVAGTGAYIPTKVVTNDDISKVVDTSDEWIAQRTGIRERRWVEAGEATLSMATKASQAALADADLTPEDIDLILVATITPEYQLPATACLLQAELGCGWIPAYDIVAACSGFVYALTSGAQYLINGLAQTVLVVGAECLSTITDPLERGTCVLFGDAAAAAIIRPAQDARTSILAGRLGADGGRGKLIFIPGGGARHPATRTTVDERLHYMKMQGREVYRFAVTQMHRIIRETCADAGISTDELTLVVPHQSNLRIIESAVRKAGIPMDKVVVNIERYGNTSSASVGVAFHEARAQGRIAPGDLVLLVAFGAGLTWGSLLMRI